MPDTPRQNTKLTVVEVRWIKNAYKKGRYGSGCRALTNKINEGRKKAKKETITHNTVRRALLKINKSVPIIPINGTGKQIITCPKCGHTWGIKK